MPSSESEVEDYMSMKFDSAPSTMLSSEEKREVESKERGIQKSQRTLEYENFKKGISESVSEKSVGSKKALEMMKKMGYKSGSALGAEEKAETEPLYVEKKQDKTGIGYENQKKRRLEDIIKEERLDIEKQTKSIDEFSTEKSKEYLEKKLANQCSSAQHVLEKLETIELEKSGMEMTTEKAHPYYRSLLLKTQQDREERVKRKRLASRVPLAQLETASGPDIPKEILEEESTRMDEEFQYFESLTELKKLSTVLLYLRKKYFYCLYCGFSYDDLEDLEKNCPGIYEDDHD
ncbi:RNA-binding protein, G-patch type, GPATCH11-like protein [Schizosaccharomyces osmophilus]|uniref:RNA-binding protein, G-patch type, GPATCH11-like protein n=1 Tax=Schizosaccharomyces osmophilus TaxID=2545709 RepID=A0AAE9WC17_9SCHI|nr:RNA-binding protein, G-patch type, GPATCH11-like protein [Schizosaccharomyces osmophilus]WBW72696.1 RNA-binding protein, G-patch type, GPATCH11-like protein [Schizosaccharomyces osmophilus]